MSEKLKSSRENTKKRGKRLLPIAALAGVLYECDKLVPTAEERLASNIKESEKSLYIPRSLSAEQQKEYDRYIHFFSANEVSAEMPQELLQQWREVSGAWQRKLALYKYDKDVESLNKILHLFVNIHQFNQFAGLARTRGINIREETDFNQILHEKDETHTRVENFDIPEINYYKLTQD